jgi:quercetin dioxygenase-like cupin family protein
MRNFYDDWLDTAAQIKDRFASSPMIAHDDLIPWVSTRQDVKVKLMISNELGFPTMGGCVLKAEIPQGWYTGRHAHGEESLHILQGEGFSVIDGERFDWRKGSTLQIPYRAVHQHFNTGKRPAQYLSAMCFPLEAFLHLAEVQQLEDCGPSETENFPARTDSQYLTDGRRVLIHLRDAPTDDSFNPQAGLSSVQGQHHSCKYLVVPGNGFQATSVAIAQLFEDPPHFHSGRHKHLEAVIYVLDGEGRSEVGGKMQTWSRGDILHVPPAMFEHEHFNESDMPCRQLRIQFGIRFWFTALWPKGYTPERIHDAEGRAIIAGTIN